MRVDAHQHFWDVNRFQYPWMPEGDSILHRNYLPDNLAPILEQNRFDGTVLVQANSLIDETWWLLDLASHYAFIKGIVGWVDLTDPNIGETLDRCQKHPKFRGVRHIVHDEPDLRWLLREDVIRGLGELARRGLPYDLLLRPPHLPLIPELADRVPGLRMVIDHIAKPLIGSHLMEPWAHDIEVVSKIPEMHCKLSGMVTEADHKNWTPDDLRPYVQHVLKVFGPERLMFGSDWPVCLLAGSWKQVLAAFTQACGALPSPVRERILGETATEFYRLHE
jgi:L-fucono-1,5-lactonase